ncbi:MAG: hypothetical protein WCE63_06605 [Acidobacteriaceae bacterium]
MVLHRNKFRAVLAGFIAIVITIGLHSAVAQDVVHGISGIVKSVDKGTKTFVVKTADGTEHTFKWTDKTAVKGTKDTGKGIAKGTEDTGKAIDKGTVDTGKDIDKGSVDTYMGAKKGAKVTVKYTEKGGEKTAVGVKDAGKATGKALE